MKRQHTYNVGPGPNAAPPLGGGTCGSRIPNDVLFERGGDDNTQYFIDPVQQLLVNSGPAPIALGIPGIEGGRPSSSQIVQAPLMAVASLRGDSAAHATQSFMLHGGASVKVFLDAWEPWQTIPLNVYASAIREPAVDTRYTWSFVNYVPIGNGPCSGRGTAAGCPRGVETPPFLKTLGSTNRSPRGEFPVSQATKDACACCHEDDRPYLLVSHAGARRGSTPIHVTVSIAS